MLSEIRILVFANLMALLVEPCLAAVRSPLGFSAQAEPKSESTTLTPSKGSAPPSASPDKETNRFKEWMERSSAVTLIVAVAAIVGCILGLLNAYFSLMDRQAEKGQRVHVNFRGVHMFADEETLSHDKYVRLYLAGAFFDQPIPETGPMDSTRVLAIPVEIRIANQKKEATSISQFQLFAHTQSGDWVSSRAYELIDKANTKDPRANAVIGLQPKEIKDVALKFYFGPGEGIDELKPRPETLQNVYLVFRDEQGESSRLNLW